MDYKNITLSNYKVITRFQVATIKLCFLAFFSLGGCSSATEQASETPKEDVPVAEFISRADALFAKRDDLAQVRSGIELLKRVRQDDRRNYEAAWKLARMNFYLGKYSSDEKESTQALDEGIDAGGVATRIEPEKPDGYFWMAANLGEKAKRNPVTGLASIGQIREAMGKVISLDPGYEGASAYDGLAQIELRTSLVGGSARKAIEHLEKAIEIEKENSYLYLHLGKAYQLIGRKVDAKKQFDQVVNMKPTAGYEFEHKEAQAEAKKMLEKQF